MKGKTTSKDTTVHPLNLPLFNQNNNKCISGLKIAAKKQLVHVVGSMQILYDTKHCDSCLFLASAAHICCYLASYSNIEVISKANQPRAATAKNND